MKETVLYGMTRLLTVPVGPTCIRSEDRQYVITGWSIVGVRTICNYPARLSGRVESNDAILGSRILGVSSMLRI